MKQVHRFTVFDGYTVQERSTEMSQEEGRTLMSTKARRRVAFVHKDTETDMVTITKRLLVCPSCGGAMTATPRYVQDANPAHGFRRGKRGMASCNEIRTYLSDQYSLFVNEALQINQIVMPERIRCRYCETEVEKANRSGYPVTITADRDKQLIFFDVYKAHPDNVLFKTMFSKRIPVKPIKSYTERVLFNCETGEVFWQFLDENHQPVLEDNCTYNVGSWTQLDTFRLLTSNYLVKRKITQAFQHVLQECPFRSADMTPFNAVLTTLFVGYPSAFYSGIPINESYMVDERFVPISKSMHRAETLPMVFTESSLPQKRTLRKLFFTSTELFFYLEQCEVLADVLGNVDLLVNVLSAKNRFTLLSDMLTYHTEPFLRDYAEMRGEKALSHLLIKHWDDIREYVKEYGVCTQATRRVMQEKWVNGTDAFRDRVSFQIPQALPDYSVVDGYEFLKLKTQRMQDHVANALKNCLKRYDGEGVIFGVRRNGTYVAAIEVIDNDTIYEFLGFRNTVIPYGTRLHRAYRRWRDQNRLQLHEDYYVGRWEDYEGDEDYE